MARQQLRGQAVRVRVKFRYNADTGEVEVFEVDDLRDGPRLADHDVRHDRAASDVARIVEANALIEETLPAPRSAAVPETATQGTPEEERKDRERNRSSGG
jgi:hypothetical protein